MANAARVWMTLGCAALMCLGCSKPAPAPDPKPTTEPAPPPAPVVQTTPAEEARELFSKRCVVCHGEHGAGDGPGAAALQPKPRSFSDQAWQTATSDERIAKVIVEGGAGVGLSPAMAANPDLANKPDVVRELTQIVRKWRK